MEIQKNAVYSLPNAADLIGCSPVTLRAAAKEGALAVKLLGRRYMVLGSELIRYIESLPNISDPSEDAE